MTVQYSRYLRTKNILGCLLLRLALACGLISLAACGTPQSSQEAAEEAIARTEFTERVENFFEYEPLKATKPSQFLIHLTDLADGSPIEQAQVTLAIREQSSDAEVAQAKARVGKVTGIYVAEVTIPRAGEYDIEFHIKNDRVDERMPLKEFQVE